MKDLVFYVSNFTQLQQDSGQDTSKISSQEIEKFKKEISEFYQLANQAYYQDLAVSVDVYQRFGPTKLQKLIALQISQIEENQSLSSDQKTQEKDKIADDLRTRAKAGNIIDNQPLQEMLDEAIANYAKIIAGSIDKKIGIVDSDHPNSRGMNEIIVATKDQKIIGFLLYRICDVFDQNIEQDHPQLLRQQSLMLEKIRQEQEKISIAQGGVDKSLEEFHQQFVGGDKFIYIAQAGVDKDMHRSGVLQQMLFELSTYLLKNPQLNEQIQSQRPVSVTFISRTFNPTPSSIFDKIEQELSQIPQLQRSDFDPRIDKISNPSDYGYDPKLYRGCQEVDLLKLNKFLNYLFEKQQGPSTSSKAGLQSQRPSPAPSQSSIRSLETQKASEL